MDRAVFTLVLALWIALAAGNLWATEIAAEAARPNLIAIVTDDQGRWAMGAYGNDEIKTPHMDRIAREGALFANAFVITPVCSPSRATYFTGLYPTEVGITDWIAPVESDAGLGLDAPSWPEALQAAGYRMAMIGKWHLGTAEPFHPKRRGFDEFMGFLAGGTTPMDARLEVDGREQVVPGPLPDRLVDAAIEFVRKSQNEPFAMCLHFRAPHLPYGPVPEEDSAPFADLDPTVPEPPGADVAQLKRWTRDYYASIHSIDRNIGRLLAVLDELELADNTLVLFTSDHGYNIGHHGIDTKGNGQWIAGGVRGPKRPNMWDTSLRVPLAVRWPAVVRPGSEIADTVTFLDVYRTILGALDVPVPEGVSPRGVDCSPLLRGESLPPRDVIFGQYDLHNVGLAYMRMVRTPKYKLVRHFKANYLDELYDLEADPDETRNLLSRRDEPKWQHVVEPLQQQMTAWQREIADPLLESTY